MQVSIKEINQRKKVFHPFTLGFKIESEQDLQDLAVRFNIHENHLNELASYDGCTAESNTIVWDYLDFLLRTKPYMK